MKPITDWNDGHDYSNSGKHDPLVCKRCQSLNVAMMRAQIFKTMFTVVPMSEAEKAPDPDYGL